MAKKNEYDYVFPSVLIRSKEVHLLKKADLEKVAEQPGVSEAIKVLAEFGYGDGKDSKEGASAASYEDILSRSLQDAYELVFSILPEEPEMKLFLYPNDYHNAKVLLKAEALKIDPSSFITEAASIPPEKLEEAVRKREFAILSAYMKQAITEAGENFAKTGDPQEIDIILDRACFGDMLAEAEKLGSDFVTGYVKLLIDILNMGAFIRLRKIGRPKNFFGKVFLGDGNVEEEFFKGNYEEDYGSIADKLRYAGYYDVFAIGAEASEESGSFATLEKIFDNLKIKFAKECKYKSFGLETAAAYLIAKEMEVRNLRIILAGLSAGMSAEAIAERLRETYV